MWLFAASLALLLAGCGGSSRVLDAAAVFMTNVSEMAGAAKELDSTKLVAAIPDLRSAGFEAPAPVAKPRPKTTDEPSGGSRTYYQYIDEAGSVRFVLSLLEVPEQWRDRAGSVELASAPPLRPGDRTAELERRRERARAGVAASVPARSNVEVQLYYAEWCGYCRKAKALLDKRGVDYVLRNVDDPATKAELIERTGSGSIPVLDVGGEFVRGYNAVAIDRLLAKI